MEGRKEEKKGEGEKKKKEGEREEEKRGKRKINVQGEDVEKPEPLCLDGGKGKQYSCCEKQSGSC